MSAPTIDTDSSAVCRDHNIWRSNSKNGFNWPPVHSERTISNSNSDKQNQNQPTMTTPWSINVDVPPCPPPVTVTPSPKDGERWTFMTDHDTLAIIRNNQSTLTTITSTEASIDRPSEREKEGSKGREVGAKSKRADTASPWRVEDTNQWGAEAADRGDEAAQGESLDGEAILAGIVERTPVEFSTTTNGAYNPWQNETTHQQRQRIGGIIIEQQEESSTLHFRFDNNEMTRLLQESDDDDSYSEGYGGDWECPCPLRPVIIETSPLTDSTISGIQERGHNKELKVPEPKESCPISPSYTDQQAQLNQLMDECETIWSEKVSSINSIRKLLMAPPKTTSIEDVKAVHKPTSDNLIEYEEMIRQEPHVQTVETNNTPALPQAPPKTGMEKIRRNKIPYWRRRTQSPSQRHKRRKRLETVEMFGQGNQQSPRKRTVHKRQWQPEAIRQWYQKGERHAVMEMVLKIANRMHQMKGLESATQPVQQIAFAHTQITISAC